MMKQIKRATVGILAIMLMGISGGLLAPTAMAVACPEGSLNPSADSLAGCNVEKDDSLMPTIWTAVRVALGVLALVAVIVIILGGVQYTTSAGDTAKVTKAKNTILYGIIGLIIALLAFAIVHFVLANIF